jgi:hypothetical protein
MFFMQSMFMFVLMHWKQLQRFPILVSYVITQLYDIKLTSNLADTYTNGLKLLDVDKIDVDIQRFKIFKPP